MNPTDRQFIITPVFMDRLAAIEQYMSRETAVKGRKFVAALFDFMYDTIYPLPFAFPAYSLVNHPNLLLRRAIFQRRYNLLYEVNDLEVTMLTIFGTTQNPDDISL